MTEYMDDELLNNWEDTSDCDIDNEKEAALLNDDCDDHGSKHGQNSDSEMIKFDLEDEEPEEDVLDLDIEEDEDFRLGDDNMPNVGDNQPKMRSDKFSSERRTEPSNHCQKPEFVKKWRSIDRGGGANNYNRGRGHFNRRRPRGNFHHHRDFRDRKTGTIYINKNYTGFVEVADNNTRLAWDSNKQFNSNPRPWCNGKNLSNRSNIISLLDVPISTPTLKFSPPSTIAASAGHMYAQPPPLLPPPAFPNQSFPQNQWDGQFNEYNNYNQPTPLLQMNVPPPNYPSQLPLYNPPPIAPQNDSYTTPNTYNYGYPTSNPPVIQNQPLVYDNNQMHYNTTPTYNGGSQGAYFNNNSNENQSNFYSNNNNFAQTQAGTPSYSNTSIYASNPRPITERLSLPLPSFAQALKRPLSPAHKRPLLGASPRKRQFVTNPNIRTIPLEPIVEVASPEKRKPEETAVVETAAEPSKATPEEDEDEETKAYRLKIEEQKRQREKLLQLKEQRRKMQLQREQDEQQVSVMPVKRQCSVMLVKQQGSVMPAKQQVSEAPDFSVRKTIINANAPKQYSIFEAAKPPTSSFMANRVVFVKNKNSSANAKKTLIDIVTEPIIESDSKATSGPAIFLSNRKVLRKDDSLLSTRLISISNLSAGTSHSKLVALTRGIGEVQELQMEAHSRQATILFKSVASAHAFFKKYQRYMLDLSMIEVKLAPMQ